MKSNLLLFFFISISSIACSRSSFHAKPENIQGVISPLETTEEEIPPTQESYVGKFSISLSAEILSLENFDFDISTVEISWVNLDNSSEADILSLSQDSTNDMVYTGSLQLKTNINYEFTATALDSSGAQIGVSLPVTYSQSTITSAAINLFINIDYTDESIPNTAPLLNNVIWSSTQGNPGFSQFTIDLYATDPENNYPLTITLEEDSNVACGVISNDLSVTSSSPISQTVFFYSPGLCIINAILSDAEGNMRTVSFSQELVAAYTGDIDVTLNSPPEFDVNITPAHTDSLKIYQFEIVATDPEGDTSLSYQIETNSTPNTENGWVFLTQSTTSPNNFTVTINKTALLQELTTTVTITVSDSSGASTEDNFNISTPAEEEFIIGGFSYNNSNVIVAGYLDFYYYDVNGDSPLSSNSINQTLNSNGAFGYYISVNKIDLIAALQNIEAHPEDELRFYFDDFAGDMTIDIDQTITNLSLNSTNDILVDGVVSDRLIVDINGPSI